MSACCAILPASSPKCLKALSGRTGHSRGGIGEVRQNDLRLSDLIYPIPVFDDASRAAHEERLAQTEIAQPAIGAVSLGAWRVLEYFGVTAQAVGGHSFGELVALCAGGRLSEPSMHAMASVRGRAMASAAKSDAGTMLAVSAGAVDVQHLIDQEKLNLVIANNNAPTQVVLSGATSEIDRATKLLGDRGIRSKRLCVAAAFHSPLVSDAQKPFAEALRAIQFAPQPSRSSPTAPATRIRPMPPRPRNCLLPSSPGP